MATYKRGRVYWYSFWFNSQRVQESTKQGNPRIARTMEAAHRTALAKGEVGIRDRKPAPTLAQFIADRFEPWAQASFTATTWREHYRGRAQSLSSYAPLASLR